MVFYCGNKIISLEISFWFLYIRSANSLLPRAGEGQDKFLFGFHLCVRFAYSVLAPRAEEGRDNYQREIKDSIRLLYK